MCQTSYDVCLGMSKIVSPCSSAHRHSHPGKHNPQPGMLFLCPPPPPPPPLRESPLVTWGRVTDGDSRKGGGGVLIAVLRIRAPVHRL